MKRHRETIWIRAADGPFENWCDSQWANGWKVVAFFNQPDGDRTVLQRRRKKETPEHCLALHFDASRQGHQCELTAGHEPPHRQYVGTIYAYQWL